MENKKSFEAIIGALILLLCGLFFSHIVKSNEWVKHEKYKDILYAKFNNIEGIKVGTEVKIAGVRVGFVENTQLDTNTFQVKVKLNVMENLKHNLLTILQPFLQMNYVSIFKIEIREIFLSYQVEMGTNKIL